MPSVTDVLLQALATEQARATGLEQKLAEVRAELAGLRKDEPQEG